MPSYPPLNLPPCPDLRIRPLNPGVNCTRGSAMVFDELRGKWLVLTPEEWVRQHFVRFLISYGYPREMIANETSLRLNRTLRRCDTVVFSPEGLRPLMIVEYKAPDVTVSQKVFDQIASYNSVLQAPCVLVSNGLRHFCARYLPDGSGYTFLRDIPSFTQLLKF